MGNPFAPRSVKVRRPLRAPETPPLRRLRKAGLTRADEEEVRARWAALSDAERFEAMEAMDNLDLEELRRQIEEMREEATASTSEPTIGEVPDGSVETVLAWVDGDAERARAALEAEQDRPTQRRTLLARLQALVGGDGG
jgi:hypothetical protein